MWISTITIDLNTIQALSFEDQNILNTAINNKKLSLREIDGNGHGVSGFEAEAEIEPTATTKIVKRAWNTQSAAQEFVDFINGVHICMTATLEEQV